MPLSISHLNDTMRRVDELGAIGGSSREDPLPDTIEMHVGRITSTTKTEGRFPGKRYEYNANTDNADTPPAGSYTEKETIWIKARGGETLVVGTNYDLVLVGTRLSDGIAIYVVVHPPASALSTCIVYDVDNLTIANNTFTTLNWNEEKVDTDSYHSGSNPSRLIAPSDGQYLAIANIKWTANATGFRALFIVSTSTLGSGVAAISVVSPAVGGINFGQTTTMQPQMAATEFIEVKVTQTSGGDLDLLSDASCTASLTKLT